MSRAEVIIRLLSTLVLAVLAISVDVMGHDALFLIIGSIASISAVSLWDKVHQNKRI
jgi:hypothetical protein